LLSASLVFAGDSSKKYSSGGGSSTSSRSYSNGSKSYSNGSKSDTKTYGPKTYSPKVDPPKATNGSRTYGASGGGDDNSRKPTKSNFNSDLSSAAKHEESRIKFKAANGKEVEINSDSHAAKVARSLPPERIQNHTIIVEKHYHDYYGPRYDYYLSQPIVYVGGGYSSLFWYAMLDWDMNRRAAWLYNHQNDIDAQLYQQQLQNAELRGRIEQLQRSGAPDVSYVDKDFRDAPDAQYDTEFVKNASIVHEGVGAGVVLAWIFGILVIVGLVGAGIWLFFIKNFE
jgi:hypothetical protein